MSLSQLTKSASVINPKHLNLDKNKILLKICHLVWVGLVIKLMR